MDTQAGGRFEIDGIPPGTHRGHASHLTFEWEAAEDGSEVDLGALKYPLIHPPSAWTWQPGPLPSVDLIRSEGEIVSHTTCLEDPKWLRPSPEQQAQEAWSREPFASEDPATLDGLVRGDPIELWLLGRRARLVRRLLRIHDPPVTTITLEVRNAAPVVWSEARYAVYSEPAEGVSIIRFAGIDASSSPVAVHLIEDGRELAVLDPMESTYGR